MSRFLLYWVLIGFSLSLFHFGSVSKFRNRNGILKGDLKMYGPELIIDLFGCDVTTFNRNSLKRFAQGMCEEIGMTPHKYSPWDDDGVPKEDCQTKPETKGYTGVQFLMESSILIHTLELRKEVFINVFSCKGFDRYKARRFAQRWFCAKEVTSRLIKRGVRR